MGLSELLCKALDKYGVNHVIYPSGYQNDETRIDGFFYLEQAAKHFLELVKQNEET
jgi:hypothetical protein